MPNLSSHRSRRVCSILPNFTILRHVLLPLVLTSASAVSLVHCGGSAVGERPRASHERHAKASRDDFKAVELKGYRKSDATHGTSLRSRRKSREFGHYTIRPEFDIPFVMTPQVEMWVKTFTTTLRERYSVWLSRHGRYAPYIEQVLAEYQVPQDLLYLGMIESGLNPSAYSSAHATGVWQFIPSTGKLYGLNPGEWVDERRDIVKSTQAAARHLKDLYNQYGDWYLAFAAYNAGPGRVNKAIRLTGSKNFFEMIKTPAAFRQETRDYVPKILAAAYVAKNRDKFGLGDVAFLPPLEFETVEVDGGLDLEVASECAGTDIDWMKNANGALKNGVTPPGERYALRIPMGTRDLFRKEYARLTPQERVRYATYKVRGRKETPTLVARRHGISKETLIAVNKLSGDRVLRVGQTLKIPVSSYTTLARTGPAPVRDRPIIGSPQYNASYAAQMASLTREGEAPQQASQKQDGIAAVVQAHESGRAWGAAASPVTPVIGDVAARGEAQDEAPSQPAQLEGAPVSESPSAEAVALASPNGQNEQQDIQPTVAPFADPQPVQTKPLYYKVRSGDTLTKIASGRGLTVAALRTLNPDMRTNAVYVGQKLKVGESESSRAAIASASLIPTEVAQTAPSKKIAKAAPVDFYKVRRGETLTSIAQKKGVTISDLKTWNPSLSKKGHVNVGQVLELRLGKSAEKSQALAQSKSSKTGKSGVSAKTQIAARHKVKPGETLWTIAKRYSLSVEDIKAMNKAKIGPKNQLKAGTLLSIPTS